MFKYLIASCSLLFIVQSAKSQWYDPEKVGKKTTNIYLIAIDKAQNGDYTTAISIITQALKLDPKFVDGYLSLAGIEADMKDYTGSVTNFEKAL